MTIPVINIEKIIAYVTKRESTVNNCRLIKLAGGSNAAWGEYLQGPRTQSIVHAVNNELKSQNKALSSEGIHSEQWQLVTLAEMHRRKIAFSLDHADSSYRIAYEGIQAIIDDINAPKKMREHAVAWLELFEEPQNTSSRIILKEFATEVSDKTIEHKNVIRLPRR